MNFVRGKSTNLHWGHARSPNKFGPNRFSRFDVYWIQTDRQPDRQAKYLCRLYVEDTRMKIRLTVCELNAGNIKPVVVVIAVVYFTNVYVFICIRPWAENREEREREMNRDQGCIPTSTNLIKSLG